jgi:transposase
MTLKQFIKDNNIEEYIRTAELTLDFLKHIPLIPLKIVTFLEELTALLPLLLEAAFKKPANSANSSRPPSQDPNGPKKKPKKGVRKPGGQPGHPGSTLKQVDNPDETVICPVDRTKLSPHHTYKRKGYEKRQVFDVDIKRRVTEYKLEILENELGERIAADEPEHVKAPVQYGARVKAIAVYLLISQLTPQERIAELFESVLDIPLSAGSIDNFKIEAANSDVVVEFSDKVVGELLKAPVINSDETHTKIRRDKYWIHLASAPFIVFFFITAARGTAGIIDAGVLEFYTGVVVHDYWRAYYTFKNLAHALCNARHLRELQAAVEDNQKWAVSMKALLVTINTMVRMSGGQLAEDVQIRLRRRYLEIIKKGIEETGGEILPRPPGKKRGRMKKTKSRNLLERLRDKIDDVSRFMTDVNFPFTNNAAERDLRMEKVHQKISGCYRSLASAKMFFALRSYKMTCQRNGVNGYQAIVNAFEGHVPRFMANWGNNEIRTAG